MWPIHLFLFTIIKYSRWVLLLSLISILLLGYSLFFIPRAKSVSYDISSSDYSIPVVKISGIKKDDKTLIIVENIFQKLGYAILKNNDKSWNVLWSYTYPFHAMADELLKLTHNQKVNHFPGSGFMTQKSNLVTLHLVTIPKSFLMPMDKFSFIKYANSNKNKSWIMKSSSHRGMQIVDNTTNIDVNGVFIQEFILDPLLIDGKKFDIGVYVLLTSIDPIRVYVYSEDILLRFCKKNYYPLNLSLPESYIVMDDYLPIWEVPSLQFYYSELNYTAKETLNVYLQHQSKDVHKLWNQIHESIRDVYSLTEKYLKESTALFRNQRSFFELVRFDFIVDKYLNVYLLEVNMSPNLSPAHFSQNSLLYEQIVFNSLNLVGLVRKFPTMLLDNYSFSPNYWLWGLALVWKTNHLSLNNGFS